jgi:hypothetical protein
MTSTVVETSGTVHADGRLELDERMTVPPCKVKVTVESMEVETALEARFRELARQWKEATLLMSSITEMATQPAYQQIIGMGRAALPWIFAEMRRQPDQWFWALKAITGADPVAEADRGKVLVMTQAWLNWAKERGY